ncbi:ABC transporter substrate-binding protein [Spongiactinospora sp. TRM90649]|uniref:ABC transporter substrate-binding protein n=1 Tax=Spongiactinospora sp. TRM90649 TaxID=3031114 RepID=UPI0023F7451B|nr:ABC transporter substrate-binding protein [Spongiactinospora sp. TRM90649]MDF5758363.1 ABC transporter substrate-binding protein [Spongiactinospora sp. TRM90649]
MFPRLPRRLGGVLVLTLALVAGCGSAGSSGSTGSSESAATDAKPATRIFKADNGEITIPADPKRVVATGYAVPVLIEAGAALAGISSWERGLPMMSEEDRTTYDKLAKVAGETAAETNYEAVAAAKPDLIVIGVPAPVLAQIDMKRLTSIAPTVAIGPTTPDAWRELSRRQADAAGRSDYHQSAKAAYEKKAAELSAKYRDVLGGMKFGHVGSYGEAASGTFQREFSRSWGTNIAEDIGVTYYGKVKKPGPGSQAVSEYPSTEELPQSLGEADAITYSVRPDGSPAKSVQHVLDSKLWQALPAVKAGKAIPLRLTEAATYESALAALGSIDQALAPLLTR